MIRALPWPARLATLGLCLPCAALSAEVSVVVVAVGEVESSVEGATLWSTRVAVEAHPELKGVDVAGVLASGGGEESDAEAGRVSLDDARAALAEVDIEGASAAAERAVRLLLRADPEGSAGTEAMLLLAEIRLAEQDEAGAVSALRRALLLDPHLRLGQGARPSMRRALKAAQEPPEGEIGSLRAEAKGGPAAVLADGRFVCVTPCTVSELDPGAHLLVFEADGRRREARLVEVREGADPVVRVELESAPRASLLQRIADRLEDEIDEDAMGPALRDVKGLFAADQAIVLDIDRTSTRAVLFDLRAGRRVRAAEAESGEGAGELLVRRLYDDLDAHAPALAEMPDELPSSLDEPREALIDRWWFWPAAGVAATAAIAIPLLLLSGDDGAGLPREDGTGAVLITF